MENQLIFLDGAMGTMLQRNGLKPGEIPELLSITNPALLTDIHRQYIEAGAQIVYANTFGANRRKLQNTPYAVDAVVTAAIGAAKKACEGTSACVTLDIGPLGALLEPARLHSRTRLTFSAKSRRQAKKLVQTSSASRR